jgi:hypothetical protein
MGIEVNEEAVRDAFGLDSETKITARAYATVKRGDGTIEHYDLATGERITNLPEEAQ